MMANSVFIIVPSRRIFPPVCRQHLGLATLWEVDDASTLGLMKVFYGRLKQAAEREDKASALAEAQRAFLSSDDYNHPYFWAPFVLVVEMRREKHSHS